MYSVKIYLNSGEIFTGNLLRIATDSIWGKKRKAESTIHWEWVDENGDEREGHTPMSNVNKVIPNN